MIKIIKSEDLKTNTNLVCTYCGKEHSLIYSKESIDYVFERDTKSGEEWCICLECRKQL